jgi:hypothetical protein
VSLGARSLRERGCRGRCVLQAQNSGLCVGSGGLAPCLGGGWQLRREREDVLVEERVEVTRLTTSWEDRVVPISKLTWPLSHFSICKRM